MTKRNTIDMRTVYVNLKSLFVKSQKETHSYNTTCNFKVSTSRISDIATEETMYYDVILRRVYEIIVAMEKK
jgi:hypothetical protein